MLLTRSLPPPIDLLALHRLAPQRYPLLLESSAHGTAQGRWDLLLADGRRIAAPRSPMASPATMHGQRTSTAISSTALDAAWQAQRVARDEPRWPFRGGWALLLGYELAAQVEPVLQSAARAGRLAGGAGAALPGGGAARPRHRRMRRGRRAAHAAIARRHCWPTSEAAAHCRRCRSGSRRRAIEEDDPQRYHRRRAARARLPAPPAMSSRSTCRAAGARASTRRWSRRRCIQRLREANPAPFAGLFAGDGLGGGQFLARTPGVGARRRGRNPADRRHAAALRRRRRCRAHPRTGRPSEGTRRARDADRPGTQRPRPRLHAGQRRGRRADDGGELRARPPHRQQRARSPARRRDAGRGDPRGVPRRHHHRLPEGALHADHRRAGRRGPRRLHRRDGLAQPRRRPRPQHPDPQRGTRRCDGRRAALPHRRGHRGRLGCRSANSRKPAPRRAACCARWERPDEHRRAAASSATRASMRSPGTIAAWPMAMACSKPCACIAASVPWWRRALAATAARCAARCGCALPDEALVRAKRERAARRAATACSS